MTPAEVARAVASVTPTGQPDIEMLQLLMLDPDCCEITVRVGGEWYKGIRHRMVWGDEPTLKLCTVCGHAPAHHVPGLPLPHIGVCGAYQPE